MGSLIGWHAHVFVGMDCPGGGSGRHRAQAATVRWPSMPTKTWACHPKHLRSRRESVMLGAVCRAPERSQGPHSHGPGQGVAGRQPGDDRPVLGHRPDDRRAAEGRGVGKVGRQSAGGGSPRRNSPASRDSRLAISGACGRSIWRTTDQVTKSRTGCARFEGSIFPSRLLEKSTRENLPQAVAEIPLGNNIALIEKLKDPAERLWYARQTTGRTAARGLAGARSRSRRTGPPRDGNLHCWSIRSAPRKPAGLPSPIALCQPDGSVARAIPQEKSHATVRSFRSNGNELAGTGGRTPAREPGEALAAAWLPCPGVVGSAAMMAASVGTTAAPECESSDSQDSRGRPGRVDHLAPVAPRFPSP